MGYNFDADNTDLSSFI